MIGSDRLLAVATVDVLCDRSEPLARLVKIICARLGYLKRIRNTVLSRSRLVYQMNDICYIICRKYTKSP